MPSKEKSTVVVGSVVAAVIVAETVGLKLGNKEIGFAEGTEDGLVVGEADGAGE